MTLFDGLNLLGTVAFATSGALVAMSKKFDPFGVFIVAFVTALGGGTLRDILIGREPVGWMKDSTDVYVITITVVLAIVFRNKLKHLSKSLLLFDTIGLGVFTIMGTEIGVQSDFSPVISIALGTMTAAFGGVIRDLLCNDIPVIFRKEIYATVSIAGAVTFIILEHYNFNSNIIYISTTLIIIIFRLLAVKYKLSLPTFYTKD